MKRVLGLVCATLMAFALTGMTVASADDVNAAAPPGPASPIVWTGNGTTNGFCTTVFNDPDVVGQEWLFVLTSPSGSSWDLTGVFSGGSVTTFGPVAGTQNGGGSIHFLVTTDIGEKLVSAQATNGKTTSILTVSHCTTGQEGPPPPATGGIRVQKIATGNTAAAPATVSVHVVCTGGTDVTIPLEGTGETSDPISDLPVGTSCTVTEAAISGVTPVYSPAAADGQSGVAVIGADSVVTVTITNNYPTPTTPETPPAVAGEVVQVTPVVAAQAVTVAPGFTG